MSFEKERKEKEREEVSTKIQTSSRYWVSELGFGPNTNGLH